MNNKEVPQTERNSEFAFLLSEFSKEISINRELVDKVTYYSSNLTTINTSCIINKETTEDKKFTGILGSLWDQIQYLKKTNEIINVTASHLQDLIGS